MAKNIISVIIAGEAKGVVEASAEARKALGEVETKSSSTSQKLAGYGKAAAAGIAGVALAAGAYAVKVGGELQEAQDDLNNALKDAHSSMAAYGSGLKPLLKDNEKWGFTNAQVDASLASLARSGITGTKALKLETLAANIAKAKHMDLASATLLATKASQGQSKALKSLGIDANVAAGGARKVEMAQRALATAQNAYNNAEATHSDTLAKANALLDESNKKGVTAAQRNALQAQSAAMMDKADRSLATAHLSLTHAQQNLTDAQKSGGQITDLLSSKFAGAASDSAQTFQGKIAAAKAQLTDTAAQIGLKLIPILLALAQFIVNTVIPGIGMIVGWVQTKLIPALSAFALKVADLYNKWVKPYLAAVVKEFTGLYLFISGIVQLVSDLFHGKWGAVWNDLKQIASGAVMAVEGFFQGLPALILKVVGKVAGAAANVGSAIGSGILHGITGAAGEVAAFAKAIVNGLIGYVNRDVIDKIDTAIGNVKLSFFGHKIGLPGHIIPNIPTLHTGGLFNSGRGEGLAWLKDGESVLTPGQMAAAFGGNGGDFIANFPSGVSPSVVNAAQRRWNRRNRSPF